jgi:hypothetical protein
MMTLRLYKSGKVPHLLCPSISHTLRITHRSMSTMLRPYRFHVCANWQASPLGHDQKKPTVPFPLDTEIGKWINLALNWPRHGFSETPGEDFFYVQEVRELGYLFPVILQLSRL